MKTALHVIAAPLAGKKEELPYLSVKALADAEVLIAESEKQGARILALAGNKSAEIVPISDPRKWQQAIERGGMIVLTSDAGYPAIMDPGREVVFFAHRKGIPVRVYPGPSSIIMALAGSGLPAVPSFFWGYVPRGRTSRQRRLKELENLSHRFHATQIIVETAYRTRALLSTCLDVLRHECWLCVAQQLGDISSQRIITAQVGEWRRKNLEEQLMPRQPAVFLIYARTL